MVKKRVILVENSSAIFKFWRNSSNWVYSYLDILTQEEICLNHSSTNLLSRNRLISNATFLYTVSYYGQIHHNGAYYHVWNRVRNPSKKDRKETMEKYAELFI